MAQIGTLWSTLSIHQQYLNPCECRCLLKTGPFVLSLYTNRIKKGYYVNVNILKLIPFITYSFYQGLLLSPPLNTVADFLTYSYKVKRILTFLFVPR